MMARKTPAAALRPGPDEFSAPTPVAQRPALVRKSAEPGSKARSRDVPPATDPDDTGPQPPHPDPDRVIRSHGLRFPVDAAILRPRIRQALKADGYERKETDAVLRIVKPGDTVIELGGGIGYMSTLMAVKCGATVHAFEGNPDLIPYIRRVHAENQATRATIHHALIGEAAGSADFYIRRNILASSMAELVSEPHVAVTRVEVRAARDVFAALNPTVLVCDIEGAEAQVIPFLPLDGLRAAVVELHPQWIGEAGVRAVFDAFAAAGLTYFPQASEAKVVTFLRGW
jgi:FkbM family methyltransferase